MTGEKPACRQAGKKYKANLFFIIILLSAGFFGFGKNSLAASPKIIINEIQISGGVGKTTQEFVELYNFGDTPVDLGTLPLKLHIVNSTGSQDTSKTLTYTNRIIQPAGYFLIASTDYTEETPDVTYSASSNSLVSDGAVYISTSATKNTSVISLVCWGSSQKCDLSLANPQGGYTLEKNVAGDWQESYVLGGTPGFENFTGNDIKPEPIVYSDEIQINELSPNPTDGKEFVEFYNSGGEPVNLKGWKLQDANLENKKTFCTIASDLKIDPNSYAIFYLDDCDTSIALNNSGGDKLILFNPNQKPVSESDYTEDAKAGYTYAFDGTDWQWTSQPTPGAKNKFDEIKENAPDDNPSDSTTSICNSAICLNEILPNPKGDEVAGEYIEIFNSGDTDIAINSWTLKDKSSTKYIFPDDTKIEAGKYLVIYRADFKFSMNNSGAETVFLLDKDDKLVSSVSYNGAKENVSYNFDGAFWHWSRYLTPGKVNKFNHAPKIKIGKIKNAYAGVPISFTANTRDQDKDKLKYSWNFGDGHRSYLKNPTHIYLKKKKYTAIFTVDDGSEKFAKTISVQVKSYPKANIKIVQLSPNPAGNDTGQEKIVLLNTSKRKINLKGWKIATGSKKLINHIINSDVLLSPNETKAITNADAFFYLNNTAMKLELRYPNGKTADKLAYQKDNIAEDEIYKKTGSQWAWIAPPTENKLALVESPAENSSVLVDNQEIQNNLGKYSENTDWQKKGENKIVLASYATNLSLPKNLGSEPRILGASTVRDNSEYFAFGRPYAPEPHWAMKLVISFGEILNSILNKALNFFS